ncbi:selenoprotein [Salix suchowensis]|nr:selenoprotein [Salix suchowensis]
MAPRKKAEETKTKPSTTPATRRSARMTRSAAKRLNARLTELPTDAGKKRKQGKAEESKKKVKTEAVTATSSESQPEVNTLEEEEDEDEDEADEEDAKEESTFTGDGVNKTIVIEHCICWCSCSLYSLMWVKKQIHDYLICHWHIVLCFNFSFSCIFSILLMFFSDCQQPRRGCFEIREEGGETFTSLLNMKRPFPPLKGLDMDEVTSIISTGSKAQPMHLIEFGWSLKSVLGGLIEN